MSFFVFYYWLCCNDYFVVYGYRIPLFILFLLTWLSFTIPHFVLCVFLDPKWISCRQHMLDGTLFVCFVLFLIHLATPCLLIGTFSLFTHKYVSSYYLFKFVFWMFLNVCSVLFYWSLHCSLMISVVLCLCSFLSSFYNIYCRLFIIVTTSFIYVDLYL